jgi:mitochondrial fission protein ELM1
MTPMQHPILGESKTFASLYMQDMQGKICKAKKHVPPLGDYAWILTNGTPGMEAQGVAVAQATGMPFKLKKVSVRGPLAWLPARIQIWLPPKFLLRSVATSEPLCPPWPRLIVSVGRQSVAPALAIKRLSNPSTFSVHIQDPKVSAHHFDWIAAPAHDGFSGPNVTTTLGAVHGITPLRVAAAKERFAKLIDRLPRPRVAVLLGGNSRAFRFTLADAEKLGRSLATMARENAGSLLVTPSGRTPPEAVAVLKRAILEVPHLIWDGTGENPYLAFLGFADAIVVTSDSVNMVTEAAGTGKPVYVESLQGNSRRIARFHAFMREAGATRPFNGRLETWSYKPINDTELIASVIRRALGIEKRTID